jgi:hypothetical protein
LEAANDAAALKSTDEAIKFMDLFYPESRMKEQFAHAEKYRNKDGNAQICTPSRLGAWDMHALQLWHEIVYVLKIRDRIELPW